MTIGIIGVGKLGICFALLLEKAGYQILASDSNKEYLENLRSKKINSQEPFVQDMVEKSNNIEFYVDNNKIIEKCDIIFTFVPTPSLEDGSYDCSNIYSLLNQFENHKINNEKSLIICCTINPGDCEKFQKIIQSKNVKIYYSPEFIAQGSIIQDLENPPFLLLGGDGEQSNLILKILSSIIKTKYDSFVTSTKAAEIIKIFINCFLTMKISYANLLGQILIKSDLQHELVKVTEAIGTDTRIGKKYFNYGFGFGGPCLPRDNRAMNFFLNKIGIDNSFGKQVDDFNKNHLSFLLDHYISVNDKSLPYCFKHISYKNGSDLLIESQQYQLCLRLLDLGYKIYCLDENTKNICDERIIFEIPNEKVILIDI